MARDTILPKGKEGKAPRSLCVGLDTLNIRSPFKISVEKQEAVLVGVVVFYLRARINERERERVRKIEI